MLEVGVLAVDVLELAICPEGNSFARIIHECSQDNRYESNSARGRLSFAQRIATTTHFWDLIQLSHG